MQDYAVMSGKEWKGVERSGKERKGAERGGKKNEGTAPCGGALRKSGRT